MIIIIVMIIIIMDLLQYFYRVVLHLQNNNLSLRFKSTCRNLCVYSMN